MELKRYYTVNEIAHIANMSNRTVERKRDELIAEDKLRPKDERLYRGWFKTKSKPFKYSYEFLSVLVSDVVYDALMSTTQLRNTIKCLTSDRYFERQLSMLDWDYFVTVTYKYPQSKDRCGTVMRRLAESIDLYSFDSRFRMFFTTEPFTSIKGYHNHFVLKLEASKKRDVIELIERECPKGRIDVKPYDEFKAGVFYTGKKGLRGENWDIFGNNLAQDGIDATILKAA